MDASEASGPTKFVAVLGPTASGKSVLAMALAQQLDGEIVACDSQQVYIGMDIGTGKPSRDDKRLVPHHLLDLVHPDELFHAARWAALARVAITRIAGRGRLPIVVGGTGLYYRALTVGLFEAPPPDEEIRQRHRAEAESAGIASLYERLLAIDPAAAAAIDPHDLIRISRALEVFEQTGTPISRLRREAQVPAGDLQAQAVVLDPPLPELRARIEKRVAAMMAEGFLDEVQTLRAEGYGPSLRPLQALGYGQLGAHLDGACTLEQAIADTVSATVAYARRQRTWFRKEPNATRFEAAPPADALAEELAGQ